MDVFYTGKENISGGRVTITGEEFHHLHHVLRKSEGSELHVADGEGIMYRVRVERIAREEAECRILESFSGFNEPRRKVTLLQALLKQPARMEWIVEKSTELGVSRIIPLTAERCLTRHAKAERWTHLARTAMKQCLRCAIPDISPLMPLEEALRANSAGNVILFHESAREMLDVASLPAEDRPLLLCIGPEGGFTEDEVRKVEAAGGAVLSLGPRRLRSETAAVAALSRILTA